MTKDEWIWVSIRIFGIFLLVLAIKAIPEAVAGVYVYAKISQATSPVPVDEMGKLALATRDAAMAGSVRAISSLIIYLPFSYYFIRHGKLLHKLASSENA